jgi:uncharacterized protein YbjQ (UPF0145 family)
MLIVTTHDVQGRVINNYIGLVTGETILGANAFKDFFASITNVVGGRSKSYEKALADARNAAIAEMIENAQSLGANAIIGVDLSYSSVNQGMLMVTAIGTAVVME